MSCVCVMRRRNATLQCLRLITYNENLNIQIYFLQVWELTEELFLRILTCFANFMINTRFRIRRLQAKTVTSCIAV